MKKIILIPTGILLAAVVLEIVLRLGGFVYIFMQEQANRKADDGNCIILCLGESTTQDSIRYSSWPRILEKKLNDRSDDISFSVINKGIAGTSSSIIVRNLDANIKKYKPDIIAVMMGINDEAEFKRLGIKRSKVYKSAPEIGEGFISSLKIFFC